MTFYRGRREAFLYKSLSYGKVQCLICPRRCIISEGGVGFCGTRMNIKGKLYTLIYGECSALAVDPIEKKPLFHFYPGSLTFSISTVGCSFKCPWCQNWEISQAKPGEIVTSHHTPEEIVKLAEKYNCNSISYTYNEPTIWFEYVYETSRIAGKRGMKNILVTNGYISEEALNEIAPYIDAANVDVKGWSEEFYRKYCKGELKPVLNACRRMFEKKIHLELTYLIIPGLNDNLEDFKGFSEWVLNNLGSDTPIHFSKFYPHYKMKNLPPTPIQELEKARNIALHEGLKYVYIGNFPGHEGENTFCPSCGEKIISRYAFNVTSHALTEDNKCKYCGEKINIKGKITERRKHLWFFT